MTVNEYVPLAAVVVEFELVPDTVTVTPANPVSPAVTVPLPFVSLYTVPLMVAKGGWAKNRLFTLCESGLLERTTLS